MKTSRPIRLLAIRFLSLGIRFVFFALFFRYSEALYGQYGLVAVSIVLGTYLLGMEFYTYAQREWLKPEGGLRHPFLHQFRFYLLVYPLVLPWFYLLFYWGFLDKSYLWLFYAVLIAEHLATEVYRLLFVLDKALWANVNLFFRSGLWLVPALVQMFYGPPLQIGHLLAYWLAGDLLALSVIGVAGKAFFGGFRAPEIRRDQLLRGWRLSLPFFVAAVSFKLVEFGDRYVLDWFRSAEELGVYTFFANMSMLLNTVVYTAVISVRYPSLMRTLMRNRKPEGNREAEEKEEDPEAARAAGTEFRHFRLEIRQWTLAALAAALIGMPVLLWILGKRQHLLSLDVFAVLLLANVIYNLSMAWHFVLYAYGRYHTIAVSAMSAALLNFLLNLALVPPYGMRGAALATLISMAVIWYVKRRIARLLLPAR